MTGPALTGCTQTPGHQGENLTAGTGECAQPGNAEVTNGALSHGPRPASPAYLPRGSGFFSRDDTHRPCGARLGSDGTLSSEQLLRRSGGSSRVTGGDNHKLQGGAHHTPVPQACVIQAMAPTASPEHHKP